VVFVLGALALLAGLAFGGWYAWRYYQARRAKASLSSNAQLIVQFPLPTQNRDPAPLTSSATATPPAAAVSLQLSVSASAPSHLRVLADGNLVFDTDLRAGENRHFTALREFEVSASDSGAVLLDLNGQTVPPLGLPGSSGTIKLSAQDLRQVGSGNAKP
jgi:hypothetical protein